jgi:hypothetical protein
LIDGLDESFGGWNEEVGAFGGGEVAIEAHDTEALAGADILVRVEVGAEEAPGFAVVGKATAKAGCDDGSGMEGRGGEVARDGGGGCFANSEVLGSADFDATALDDVEASGFDALEEEDEEDEGAMAEDEDLESSDDEEDLELDKEDDDGSDEGDEAASSKEVGRSNLGFDLLGNVCSKEYFEKYHSKSLVRTQFRLKSFWRMVTPEESTRSNIFGSLRPIAETCLVRAVFLSRTFTLLAMCLLRQEHLGKGQSNGSSEMLNGDGPPLACDGNTFESVEVFDWP